MSRKRGVTNTCHVCLRSRMAHSVGKCPLCLHRTCGDCLVELTLDGAAMMVCLKCKKDEEHRHPTRHRTLRRKQ